MARDVLPQLHHSDPGGGSRRERRALRRENRIRSAYCGNSSFKTILNPPPIRVCVEAHGQLPGTDCYCGNRGCIETFLSGAGLTRDYRARSGQQRTAVAIAEAAEAGDPMANECLDIYMDGLARSLASIINVLDPDAIVLGGGLSN